MTIQGIRNSVSGDGADWSQVEGQYLTFELANQYYGVPIQEVIEIVGIVHITSVPKTDPYVKGIINLRGKVLPVFDLRLLFGMPEIPYDSRTCIVVMSIQIQGEAISCGIIVDTVVEVCELASQGISATPDYGQEVDASKIRAMGHTGNGDVVIMVNMEQAFDGKILGTIEA